MAGRRLDKMRVKIHLDTITDIGNFVVAVTHATSKQDQVYVTDGGRCCINAKSFLGLVAAREFDELWCESEKDIYTAISHFVV
jgi:hypothetical protein